MLATKHLLKQFAKEPVLYIGEVGNITVFDRKNTRFVPAKLFKYGITNDAYRRIMYCHMKNFEYFELKLIKRIERNREVESRLTRALVEAGLHVRMNPFVGDRGNRGTRMKELFYLEDPESQLEVVEGMIDYIVQGLHPGGFKE